MARMPCEQRLRLGERRQVLGIDQPLHGDRAQIRDHEIVAGLERLGCRFADVDAETGDAVAQTEKDRFARRRERACVTKPEERLAAAFTT